MPAMQEMGVRSLGQEDPLEKAMAPHSRTLAWKIPWTEKPGRLQSMGSAKSRTRLSDFTSLHFTSLAFVVLGKFLNPFILLLSHLLKGTNIRVFTEKNPHVKWTFTV